MTKGSFESAMKPPLANCGPAVQKSMSESWAPAMLRRRIEAAWETAQKFAAARQPPCPGALMMLRERFERVRQKLTRAWQLLVPPPSRQRLYTSILPLMVTSRGDEPRPATSV